MENLYWLFLFCAVSYFIGNVNFSIILSKSKIRTVASGNPGATNMMRLYGFKMALLIFILDALKGFVPALVGVLAFGGWGSENGQIALYACGLAAVLGHCFPVIYKFKGGKGISSIAGIFFAANPLVTLLVVASVGLYWAFFEYGAIASFFLVTFMVIWQGIDASVPVMAMLAGIYFLVWFTHRTNIKRLISGRENHASLLRKLKAKKLRKQHEAWKAEERNVS